MLLGGVAGHGMEPVGEVGGTFRDSPVFHGVCHYIRHRRIKSLTLIETAHQRLENVLGKQGSHHATIENVASENL